MSITAVLLAGIATAEEGTAAQSLASRSEEPGRAWYRELDGSWREVGEEQWGPLHAFLGLEPSAIRQLDAALGQITYEDVANRTNAGFDDPVLGVARRTTAESALAYALGHLDVEGSVDILILESELDGSGPLARGSALYAGTPNGFAPGWAFEHLVTGVDPRPLFPDATFRFDFGYSWNSEMDSVGPAEYDLYSVCLHEFAHALGIASASSSDGTSLITESSPGVFTTYDDLLFAGGLDLWTAGGEFAGIPNDLTGDQVVFRGPLASQALGEAVPVHSPPFFRAGSSLSHWSKRLEQSVMRPAISQGVERRVLQDWEIDVLYDLGFPPPSVPRGGEIECSGLDPGVVATTRLEWSRGGALVSASSDEWSCSNSEWPYPPAFRAHNTQQPLLADRWWLEIELEIGGAPFGRCSATASFEAGEAVSRRHGCRSFQAGDPGIVEFTLGAPLSDLPSVTFLTPATSRSYVAGERETMTWELRNIPSDHVVTGILKRDSAPSDTGADGTNWIEVFTESAHAGAAQFTIPATAAGATDWRFYILHEQSGSFGASAFRFSIQPCDLILEDIHVAQAETYARCGTTRTRSLVTVRPGGGLTITAGQAIQVDGQLRVEAGATLQLVIDRSLQPPE